MSLDFEPFEDGATGGPTNETRYCRPIPCPSAITVLLLCILLKQFSLGSRRGFQGLPVLGWPSR
ncbi:hypothetical protein DCG74_23765 [Bradyrhizobium sp. WBAH42]|nr:hypothetical protein [Bradyrhizobium sp. WBAH30]MDD1547201.1 hypothetical protein [Bradyrhizobium sp. WBAH41]MDD1560772.1 hypothetical protein [Bradyrhizobium sp. WBAH23]MDD1568245.1 hypothetical protein [Bradyrhizobium sp. WBAH33]MDD1594132.1 hypothetical protein [Bradyrhizobium sp. WBAH42]NRB91793.1 hypothetical protein [Bradyrhizobium sp. WBAH10]QCJ91290.1 hypothetical protein DAA57_24385 [Bradyrhizobium yuanmingense]